MFRLHAMGLNTCHSGDFIIDRPNGSGDCLLIVFKTDAFLELESGRVTVPADSAVIFYKDTPQLYGSVCDSYENHYLHFDLDGGEDKDSIVFDRLLEPDNIKQAEELLRLLSRENVSDSRNKDEYISMLIRMVLLKLSEAPSGERKRFSDSRAAELQALRAEIYASPAAFGSVDEMAARLNISPSHFQQIYKKEFGLSCYDDLLSARITTAQFYLGSTALPVYEIARLCGYYNTTCFLHRFKQRTGLTPSQYRIKVGRNSE